MAKMNLECLECGKKFKVSPLNLDPECPKCGGVDLEVAYVPTFSNRWSGNPFEALEVA